LERHKRDSETAIGETQKELRNSNWRGAEGTLKQQSEIQRRDSETIIGDTKETLKQQLEIHRRDSETIIGETQKGI
jgi:hypothetical protein